MKLIEINFYAHHECKSPAELLEWYKPTSGFIKFIRDRLEIQRIHHMDSEHDLVIDGVRHLFFKSVNKPWYIPLHTLLHVRRERPDVVLVHGVVFQLQVLALNLILGGKSKIINQHHGEPTTRGIRRFFQKITDRYIHAYLFTSAEMADEWIADGQVNTKTKCHSVLEASVDLHRVDPVSAAQQLGLRAGVSYLWVGRLIRGKDPFTVLQAYKNHALKNPRVNLYMIYQRDDLLSEIKAIIEDPVLKDRVHLVGFVPPHELALWYSACEYFVSGSHKEGSGYSLLEAMACGCIPMVTDIPSFKKITDQGKFGFLFQTGNAEALTDTMQKAEAVDRQAFSKAIMDYFKEHLTYQRIADDIYAVCQQLTAIKAP